MRLTCAAAVSHIIEKYGAERLKEAMLFVEKAWPNDPRRFQGWILRGVAAFQEQLWGLEPSGTLAAYKNLVSTARQKIGARFTLKDVITKAQERFPYRPHGEQAVCQALVDLYNWRRRNHRI